MATFNEPGVVYRNVTRDEAQQLLGGLPVGAYIVRPSSQPGNLSVTFNSEKGRFGHLLLTQGPGGWTTDGIDTHHPTVRDLLEKLPNRLLLDSPPAIPESPAGGGAYARVPQGSGAGYNRVPTGPGGGAYGSVQPGAGAGAGYGAVPNYGAVPGGAGAPEGYETLPQLAGNLNNGGSYGHLPQGSAAGSYGQVPQGGGYGAVPNQYGRAGGKGPNAAGYGSVNPQYESVTVNIPVQLAEKSVSLMQARSSHDGIKNLFKFVQENLPLLNTARQLCAGDSKIYSALAGLGREFSGFYQQLEKVLAAGGDAQVTDAISKNAYLQQHFIAMQMQCRALRQLVDARRTGAGLDFASAITSPLGAQFWAAKIGSQNNTVKWRTFFHTLSETIGQDLTKKESFVKFMFDCNRENKVTTESFNMFIHWFNYDNMRPPTTVKDFLVTLISRAEAVFFFTGFHGYVSRAKAERILQGQKPKSFLIRLSDSNAGVFILTYVDSKLAIRHRLLNQLNRSGFMVEDSVFKTLPDLLNAHSGVLSHPMPNSIVFDAPSIYGGGAALQERLLSSSMAGAAQVKSGAVWYHARIVCTDLWVKVRLELRESEMSLLTTMAPLRKTVPTAELKDVRALGAHAGRDGCFVVSGARGKFVFASSGDAAQWVQALQGVCGRGAAARRSTAPLSAADRLLAEVATRRIDDDEARAALNQLLFAQSNRQPNTLAEVDHKLLHYLNAAFAQQYGAQKPKPTVHMDKIGLDFDCEVQLPCRDRVHFQNSGQAPVDVAIAPVTHNSFSIKFTPKVFALKPGEKVAVDISMVASSIVEVEELVHVSFGPGAGFASVFLALTVRAKISEELKFEDIDIGPKLGSGAFGQVYQGTFNGREVAVKCVGFEPDYDQELGILRELRYHKNIVEYYGACKRVPFQGFIVLEYVPLGSLDKYIHDKSFQLDLAQQLRVAYDIACGLAHLHACKIMHLDLKPANVLVNDLNVLADVCVKLADFGLSQSRDDSRTFRGEYVEGTLLYMAPEMLREKLFSFKGDIFSFAMTLWEMINRVQPYTSEKHRHLKKPEFEKIRERGDLPSDLREIQPQSLKILMSRMYNVIHTERPSSDECVEVLAKIRREVGGL